MKQKILTMVYLINFNFVKPSNLAKKFFEIKDTEKNNDFVEEMKNRWSKIKHEIEEMSEQNGRVKYNIKNR